MALGTASRSNVSAYIRNRVQRVDVFAPESRPLVTNFNGTVEKDRLIVSATWNTWNNASVVMSAPVIASDQKSCTVQIKGQYAGRSVIRCTATFNDGGTLVQQWSVNIACAPLYEADNAWISGPTSLSAVYP